MLLLHHEDERFLHLGKFKHSVIQNGLDTLFLNTSIHLTELVSRSQYNTTSDTCGEYSVKNSGNFSIRRVSKHSCCRDQTVSANRLERLLQSRRAANIHDDIDTSAITREALGFLAPVGCLAVVDDMMSTERFQPLCLVRRARCGNY